MKSLVADLKNSETGGHGGASKAAAFLEYFIEKDTRWVHLDIAGTAFQNSPSGENSDGSTGFGTQLVLKYLQNEITVKPSTEKK